jgi:hypothetical protein
VTGPGLGRPREGCLCPHQQRLLVEVPEGEAGHLASEVERPAALKEGYGWPREAVGEVVRGLLSSRVRWQRAAVEEGVEEIQAPGWLFPALPSRTRQ